MSRKIDCKAYLDRIGYRGSLEPSVGVLHRLHLRHLLSVPFENLDIHLGRPIVLSDTAFFDKIVKHRRGGFCYELNGSFAALLKRLGFRVSILSARVAGKNGGFSPDFDHMTLLVQLEERWLADVGFGDSFTEPKRLDTSSPQEEDGTHYRISRTSSGRLVSRWDATGDSWQPQYKFTLLTRRLADFVPRCRWQETSPDSHFRKGRLITRLTPTGRVTLTDTKLIVTRGSKRVEKAVRNSKEFGRLLHGQFGVDFPTGAQIHKLSRQR
jgi:N-hydroxyarylamine O-acetyltransferase